MLQRILKVQSIIARITVAGAVLLCCASQLHAQRDTSRMRVDSVRLVADSVSRANQRLRATPPLSPSRAFLTSLLVPGLGQTRLERGSTGALFAAVELGAFAMIRRTSEQVREAQRFLNDSLPGDFSVGTDGSLRPTSLVPGGFTNALVRRRRLHREDWIAVVAFNHLLSGADAFVSAQLWDLPTEVSVYPTPSGGAAVVATLRW